VDPRGKGTCCLCSEQVPGQVPRSGAGTSLPGLQAEGSVDSTTRLTVAITHRRRAKWFRLPPGCARPASRGTRTRSSFVSGWRSAPPQLADVQPGGRQPGSGSAPQSSSLLCSPSPSPSPSPSRHSLGSHDVIQWKSAMLRNWNNPALPGTQSGRGRQQSL
jgi:hypothetical protein